MFFIIPSSLPVSKMVSASSITSQLTFDRYISFLLRAFCNLVEVDTRTSTPASSSFFSSKRDLPMLIPSHFILQWWLKSLPTFLHCNTSYLFVVRTRARGRLLLVNGAPSISSYFLSRSAIGSMYARVFPLPVGEMI